MNFKADDYLVHHGIKGMKWRKHKYKLVKGADGKYHYIYDDAKSTANRTKSSKSQMFRQARSEEKDKDVGKMSREYLQAKRANTGAKPLTETYLVPTKTADDGLLRTSKLRSTVLTGRSGEQKQREEKRESTRNKKQVEAFANNVKNSKAINDQKSAAILRKEADKARKTLNDNSYYLGGTRDKNGKFSGAIAKNETNHKAQNSKAQMFRQARAEEKDKVVGKMSREYLQAKRANTGAKPLAETYRRPEPVAPWQTKYKPVVRTGRSGEEKQRSEKAKDSGERAAQQYLIKRTQEAAAIKRKKADEWRKADPSIESLGYSSNPFDTRANAVYDRGSRSTDGRYSKGRTSGGGVLPSKETRKRLRRNKRKKTVADVKRFINGLINR